MAYLMTLSGDSLASSNQGTFLGTDFFPGSSNFYDKQLANLVNQNLAFKNPHVIRRTKYRHGNHQEFSGILGELGKWAKGTGEFLISPLVSIGKGAGHFVMEAGRGISTGDVGRIFASPFRGVGHGVGTKFRSVRDYSEYYWRPSKMGWMRPVGSVLATAGLIPTPASPFLLAAGAALTGVGAVGGTIRQKDLEKKAIAAQNKRAALLAEQQKKDNTMWFILAGAMGVGAVIYLM